MARKNQQEHQPTISPTTTDYQAEYEEFCEVIQLARNELRDRAELAAIQQEKRVLRDILLLPLIYQSGQLAVTEEFADALVSSVIGASQSSPANSGKAIPSTPGFSHIEDYRVCRWSEHEDDLVFNETQRVVMRRLHEDLLRDGLGLTVKALVEGTSRPLETRLDHVFRNQGQYHPAWAKGLIQNVGKGVYRLNLLGHRKDTGKATDRGGRTR